MPLHSICIRILLYLLYLPYLFVLLLCCSQRCRHAICMQIECKSPSANCIAFYLHFPHPPPFIHPPALVRNESTRTLNLISALPRLCSLPYPQPLHSHAIMSWDTRMKHSPRTKIPQNATLCSISTRALRSFFYIFLIYYCQKTLTT